MAHLIKMLTKNTSLPSKIREIYGATRTLATCDSNVEFNVEIQPKSKGESSKKPKKKDFHGVILQPNTLRKIETVTGISFTGLAVGWAKICIKELALKEYNAYYFQIGEVEITEVLACAEIKKVVPMIPKADLYILERSDLYAIKRREIRTYTMISSMLAVQLHGSSGSLGDDNILYQDRSVINRMYNLALRTERISAGQVLRRKFDGGKTDKTIKVKDIKLSVTSEVVQPLFSSNPTIRDTSSEALFIALSFVQANLASLQRSLSALASKSDFKPPDIHSV